MKRKKIDANELYKFYVIENMSQKELSEKYNISISAVQRRLSANGIKKGKKLWLEKVKENNLKKYGVENVSQLKEVKEKKRQSAIKKYGVENISQAKEIKDKKTKKAFEKYNVSCVLKAPEVKEKIKETNLQKYGVENASQNEKIIKKRKKTNIEKYGDEYPLRLPEVKEKIKKTNLEKYGFESASQNEEVKEKAKQTCLKKYGVEYTTQVPLFKEKIKQTCMEKYGVPSNCLTEKCRKANSHSISKINQKISKLLNDNGIKNKLEYNLGHYSFDIQIKDTNILIEINPTYTHNSTKTVWFNKFERPPMPKDYHYNKTLTSKQKGYRCIHVFDWDDILKIINLLKSKEKLGARKCELKEVSLEETASFLNNYHLQSNCKGQDIRLGLYYNNELVEIMTFGKPRYNKKYEYELIRLCTKPKYKIVGGTERLFKEFFKKYNPSSIISYCDNSKFNGTIYEMLGFDLKDYGKPSKHWYNVKTKKHITDNLLRQRGYDQLFNTNYGKGTSNRQLMIENGFVEIYDCGQSTYIWKKQD